MRRVLKTILSICIIFSIIACAAEEEQQQEEMPERNEMTEDMSDFWQNQRDEFAGLAENQLDKFDEKVSELRDENEENEKIERVESQIDEIREDLSGLKEEGEAVWQDSRDDIADALDDLRSEIENI